MDRKQSKEHQTIIEEHLEALARNMNQCSSTERILDVLLHLGIAPGETLEMRLTSQIEVNLHDLAQRAMNAFLLAFRIPPTILAVHPAVASFFEASEVIFRPHLPERYAQGMQKVLFGREQAAPPLHIVADPSLDTRTVAVRFKLDSDSAEYQEAVVSLLKRLIEAKVEEAREKEAA